MALPITITNAGRAEVINGQNTGTGPVTITQIGFGTGQYNPAKTQTALQAQVKRLGSIAGQAVADDTIHVMAKDESTDTYNVGEFGLFSDKGTLIAVYSQPAASGWIIQKAAPSTLLLATDIILESLDATSITFGDILFINPPATEAVAGVTMLVNNLTSSRSDAALTAAMGKKLNDEKEPAIAPGAAGQYWGGNKTWRDFATDVRATVLTGLSTATATAAAATDSLLTAIGKLQAQITGLAASKLNIDANAMSATKLQTARTIGGVAFDGSANINLPGVNIAGNQSTTGNAATATKLQTDRTIGGVAFDGSANINLPGVNTVGNQSTTGNAATASKLATARTIAVAGAAEGSVAFDGSGNVSIATTTPRVSPSADPTSTFRATVFGASTDMVKVMRTDTAGFENLPQYGPGLAWSTSDTHAFFSPSYNTPKIRVGAGSGTNIAWAKDLAFTDSDITGNAATATRLATARTIGGVAFDGSANINLPGVNTAGNQNTTGNAATATKLATARTISLTGGATGSASFDGSGNVSINVDVPDLNVMAGAVMAFARSTAPNGWLKANGAAVSRTAYAGLFAAIGTTFGVGDGSTTFNLPDMRGEFLRGWDDARGVDSGRGFGTWQDSDNKSHTHTASTGADAHTHTWSGTTSSNGDHTHTIWRGKASGNTSTSSQHGDNMSFDGTSSAAGDHTHTVSGTTSSDSHTHVVTVNAAGGVETRPRNRALLICIKY